MNQNEKIILRVCQSNKIPIRLANLILAQAKHETGNFTSAVFKDCSNGFGYSAINQNVACPDHSFYKRYNNLAESTQEVINWLKRRQNEGKFPAFKDLVDPDQYAGLLKSSGYYTDLVSNYANGLARFLNDYQYSKSNWFLFAGIFLFLLVKK